MLNQSFEDVNFLLNMGDFPVIIMLAFSGVSINIIITHDRSIVYFYDPNGGFLWYIR